MSIIDEIMKENQAFFGPESEYNIVNKRKGADRDLTKKEQNKINDLVTRYIIPGDLGVTALLNSLDLADTSESSDSTSSKNNSYQYQGSLNYVTTQKVAKEYKINLETILSNIQTKKLEIQTLEKFVKPMEFLYSLVHARQLLIDFSHGNITDEDKQFLVTFYQASLDKKRELLFLINAYEKTFQFNSEPGDNYEFQTYLAFEIKEDSHLEHNTLYHLIQLWLDEVEKHESFLPKKKLLN